MTQITKRNRLSAIMKKAWVIFKSQINCFSTALKQAWAWFKLKMKLVANEKVSFQFIKKDGTIRTAIGTLKNLENKVKGEKNNNIPYLQVYWDIEKQSFRCFLIKNLIRA